MVSALSLGKRKAIVMVTIVVGFALLLGTYYTMNTKPQEDEDVLVHTYEITENMRLSRTSTIWPWKYFGSLTFDKIVEQSDIVAIVEITSVGTSYNKEDNFPFTIFQGRIVQTLIGEPKKNEINILQYGGYFKPTKSYVLSEGIPLLGQDDVWLFFMEEITSEPSFDLTLPTNTYHPQPLTSLKLEKDKLTTPLETGNILPPQLQISNLTIEEFTKAHISP